MPAELHVGPGGFHVFNLMTPHTSLAQAVMATRNAGVAQALRGRE